MASLFSLSKAQLESLKREQINAIETHKSKSQYSTNPKSCSNTLKRLQTRLLEIETALTRFRSQ